MEALGIVLGLGLNESDFSKFLLFKKGLISTIVKIQNSKKIKKLHMRLKYV